MARNMRAGLGCHVQAVGASGRRDDERLVASKRPGECGLARIIANKGETWKMRLILLDLATESRLAFHPLTRSAGLSGSCAAA